MKGLKRFIVSMLTVALVVTPLELRSNENVVKAETTEVVGEIRLNTETKITKEGYYSFTITDYGKVSGGTGIYQGIDKKLAGYSGNYPVRLAPGTYYTYLLKEKTYTVTYEVNSPTDEKENNDTFDTAMNIETNMSYTGNLHQGKNIDNYHTQRVVEADIYKFKSEFPGSLYVSMLVDNNHSQMGGNENNVGYIVSIYSEDEELNTKLLVKETFLTQNEIKTEKIRVPAGIYYIKISDRIYRHYDYYDTIESNDYSLKVNFQEEKNSVNDTQFYEQEFNDSMEDANVIEVNKEYTGNLAPIGGKDRSGSLPLPMGWGDESSSTNDEALIEDKDYYKVVLPNAGTGKLRIRVPRENKNEMFRTQLYKQETDGNLTLVDQIYSGSNPVSYGKENLLTAGMYYIVVDDGLYHSSTSYRDEEDNDYVYSGDSFIDYNIQLQFTQKVIAESLEIAPETENTVYYAGEEHKLDAVITPENVEDNTVTWSSSDTKVAKVDEDGNVTCVAPGTVFIYAKTNDGSELKAEYKIVVKKCLVEKIEVSAEKNTITVGEKVNVDVTVLPENATNPDYYLESSDESIATVDAKGVVTGKKAGTVTITAYAEDGSEVVGELKLKVVKSGNCNLSKLKITKGTLNRKFNPNVTSYTLTLNKYTSRTVITPVLADRTASYRIDGKKWEGVECRLNKGEKTTVKIKVTAANGKSKTYKILVKRSK